MANHHQLFELQLVEQVQAHHREAQPAHSPRLTILLEHYLNKLYQLILRVPLSIVIQSLDLDFRTDRVHRLM